MSCAICTLLLKLPVLLLLLLVVRSDVQRADTESIGNSTKKEIKGGSNITCVSSVLQDVTKNTSLPIRDVAVIVEAPVEIFGAREVEKDGVTKIEKKRESQVVVDSKEKVKLNLRQQTNKRKAKSLERMDDKKGRSSEHFRNDEDSYDQDNEEVNDNDNDNEKGYILKTGMVGPDAEEEDDEDDPLHDSEDGQSSDDDEEYPRKLKRDGRHGRQGPKIWDQWGKWSSCSVSCGVGKLTRWRHCIAGGCSIGEKEAQLKSCTFSAC